MIVLRSAEEVRDELRRARRAGATIGFVPTMGFLHAGHVSLIERAAQECDLVVVSVFVNPLQFSATEDLDHYPRDPERDAVAVSTGGADVLFLPSVDEMYGDGTLTTVTVEGVTRMMEGAARPTHFAGVATVVAKLFSIVGESRAYFGEKDYQQLVVVRRMAADLSMPVTVIGCPIVREPDGLALSSRNVYLSPDQREAAPVLLRALRAGAALVTAGESDPATVRAAMTEVVAAEPRGVLDYAEVAAPETLEPPDTIKGEVRLLIAARFGTTRLLDNLAATPPLPVPGR